MLSQSKNGWQITAYTLEEKWHLIGQSDIVGQLNSSSTIYPITMLLQPRSIFQILKGKEEFVWADILVTSILDGGHFWAQVGGEVVNEKLRDIINLLQSEVRC